MTTETKQTFVVLSDKAAAIMNTPVPIGMIDDIYSIGDKRAWVVVATESNGEQTCSKALAEKGLAAFLPTHLEVKKITREKQHVVRGVVQRTRPSHERKFVEKPLLSGYIFAQLPFGGSGESVTGFTAEGQSRLLNCQGVRAVLGGHNGPIAIPDRIVTQLIETQDKRTRAPSYKEAHAWMRKGEKANISEGPFANLGATIERVRENDTVEVLVDIFGRLTQITLEIGHVEKNVP